MTGRILFNQYEIQETIGQGGMGIVYLAKDTKNNINVAIKRVYSKNRDRDSILREPKILRRINHSNIVKLYDVYETDDSIFFIMEFINGKPLNEGLRKEGHYSENQVIYWAVQLCEALSYLHNQEPYPIIFRDMKPSNILVDKNDKVTLIDFGIAKQYIKNGKKDDKVAMTRGYCSPEQYIENTFDNRSDIYSLGVTMHNLLSGVAPSKNTFQIKPIREYRNDISQEMEYIITKTTMIDKYQRYQNIEDLKYDLLNIDKVNTDLRKLVVRQIITYAVFFLMYIISFIMIFLGFSKLKGESYSYSKDLVIEGNENLSNSNFTLAYKNFEKAINLDGTSSEAYEGLYNYYYKIADYTSGINYIKPKYENLNKIIGLKEINNIYLAKYYYKMGNSRETLKYAKDAYEINKESGDAIYLLALSHIMNKDSSNGEKYITDLENLSYDPYKIDFLYGKLSVLKEDYNSGINYYAKIIDNSSDNDLIIEAYISMAMLYKDNSGTWANGEELFFLTLEEAENSIDKYEKNIELKFLKATSYKEKSKETEGENRELYLNLAIDNYYEVLNFGRDEIDMYVEIAYLYRDLARHMNDVGTYDLALQILEDASIKYPEEFLPQYYLTTLKFEKEFFKDNEKERDFQSGFESFNKAKAFAETEMDFEWVLKLESYINEKLE